MPHPGAGHQPRGHSYEGGDHDHDCGVPAHRACDLLNQLSFNDGGICDGASNNIGDNGHNWRVRVIVSAAELDAIGVVMDFLYDALDLKRTDLEYVTGAFHDIGKFAIAVNLKPEYSVILDLWSSSGNSIAECERELTEWRVMMREANSLPRAVAPAPGA